MGGGPEFLAGCPQRQKNPRLTSSTLACRFGKTRTFNYFISILSESFGFLQSGSQEHFEFRADWYRGGAVAALVLEYYLLLRSVLRAKPHLRACLTRCRHCRIFFLTHPRNAGRHDLRCPFGCREAHRQQRSAQRSVAYYGDAEGKSTRSALNQRRPRKYSRPGAARATGARRWRPRWSRPVEPAMVEHVRMVSSLIEGRRVSRREVLEMLARVLRQHTICRRRKIDQTVAWLNEQPP